MKKVIALSVFAALALSSAALAMSPEEKKRAHYQEMKKIKDAQRLEREARRSSSSATVKEKGFWDREAERAGFAGTGNRIGHFFQSLNPAPFLKNQEEAYNQRKASGGVK